MDLSRRQLGHFAAALYLAGGLLLLLDFMTGPRLAEAHLPLAWHVFPVSLIVSLAAAIAGFSAPLDPVWYVPPAVLIGSYVAAMAFCALALMRLVSGVTPVPEEPESRKAIDEGNT